jgi:hypothetical protein
MAGRARSGTILNGRREQAATDGALDPAPSVLTRSWPCSRDLCHRAVLVSDPGRPSRSVDPLQLGYPDLQVRSPAAAWKRPIALAPALGSPSTELLGAERLRDFRSLNFTSAAP